MSSIVARIEIENGLLTIERDGITARMAASETTKDIVPVLARPLLSPDELAALELLGLPYVGIIVRERHVSEAGVEREPPEVEPSVCGVDARASYDPLVVGTQAGEEEEALVYDNPGVGPGKA